MKNKLPFLLLGLLSFSLITTTVTTAIFPIDFCNISISTEYNQTGKVNSIVGILLAFISSFINLISFIHCIK